MTDGSTERMARKLLEREPHTETKQYRNNSTYHTDADYLRRLHGMPRFDPDAWQFHELGPQLFTHTWDGGVDHLSGGHGCFAIGPEGSGKSTLGLRISEIEMDQNDSRVVWRAVTGSRSEWLPYAPVARVCIPAGYEPTAMVVPKERRRGSQGVEVDLEDVVREVVYYEDVMDLNLNVLGDGIFNVVYPDPEMRGCQWVYEEADRVVADKNGEVEFKGGHDPVNHWWFGWGLSLVERGPFAWTAWMCDEVKSLAREGASNDKYGTLLKIELLGDAMEDFRKNGIARYFFGHKDKHVHNLWRDRIRFRIAMNGTANPRNSRVSSIPVGFETVPMEKDMMAEADTGTGILYNEARWEFFGWPNISKSIQGDLKVYLERESSSRATSSKEVTA